MRSTDAMIAAAFRRTICRDFSLPRRNCLPAGMEALCHPHARPNAAWLYHSQCIEVRPRCLPSVHQRLWRRWPSLPLNFEPQPSTLSVAQRTLTTCHLVTRNKTSQQRQRSHAARWAQHLPRTILVGISTPRRDVPAIVSPVSHSIICFQTVLSVL